MQEQTAALTAIWLENNPNLSVKWPMNRTEIEDAS